ncbi:MAG: chemotaxis protein CheA [Deltaproteobacteria bacterium]|nr:chemotaxis protein CheA [Deltaproteobacteria bacterium]
MDVFDASLAELFEQYKDEVRETIGTLDSELVAIEQDQSNSEIIFSIFRHLHSLKGSSKMFNVDNIGHLAHKLEDLMQIIDKDNSILARNPKIVEMLFRGNDIFRDIISRLEDDISFTHLTPDHAQFIEAVNHQLDMISRKDSALVDAAKILLDEFQSLLPALEEIDTESLQRAVAAFSTQLNFLITDTSNQGIKYSYNNLDLTEYINSLDGLLGKLATDAYSADDVTALMQNVEGLIGVLFDIAEEGIMGPLAELNDGVTMFKEKNLEIDPMIVEFFSTVLSDLKEKLHTEAAKTAAEPKTMDTPTPSKSQSATTAESVAPPESRGQPQQQAKTIRVDEKKIDLFLDSVGKLITQSEILNHLQFSFREAAVNPALVRDFAAVNRTISADIVNLQRSIMEVRQVEMNNILKKFPRLVRDVSHKMGKDVELIITGERVPIDKSLLDDVEQAMIHIIRNAIDHGLEMPEARVSAGKNRRGRILISVVQEEASIAVEVKDDGQGVDFSTIRRKALERGIIDQEEYDNLTDVESEMLLFRSGITTKDEATDISGRGVGMDVVLSNMKKWNGDVTVESVLGQGTNIRLRIPITNTLLTKEAILLKLSQCMFCLPLEYIVEIVTVSKNQIHQHKSQSLFQHRQQVITVVDIKDLLNMEKNATDQAASTTIIILRGKTNTRKAIAADEIIGQQKIVIKNFDIEAFRRLPYYQGLTLLGDGRVVLVLDAEKIVD